MSSYSQEDLHREDTYLAVLVSVFICVWSAELLLAVFVVYGVL